MSFCSSTHRPLQHAWPLTHGMGHVDPLLELEELELEVDVVPMQHARQPWA
jgi:hypothetical protein